MRAHSPLQAAASELGMGRALLSVKSPGKQCLQSICKASTPALRSWVMAGFLSLGPSDWQTVIGGGGARAKT